ncbi:FBD-associated F-box protein At4g10400-like [Chenopodium quinoa]|uniref:FBD-associated F-box protein At4g10400-like n=1 Tax=Chenopodium quinoa TaxID=63459 RepID=UPI000B799191|nr:FBD-associated F-box protein At4g10400-like [Chenopodium quinoa]
MESGGGQDRLSSLPDDILTEILSRLPIKSAISISVLSHRWRHHWTGVTRLEFCTISTFKLNYILQNLTSPKLEVLNYSHNNGQDTFRQKVLQVISSILFPIPECLLNCRSLVILDLFGPFARESDAYRDVDIQLPNLKRLSLRSLTYLPHWFGSLRKSSPLLEDLTLRSSQHFMESLNAMQSMNIFFPNLKSLELGLVPYNVYQTPDNYSIISIDAPKLTNLVTYGCVLPYGFRTNPTALVKACIDLRRCEMRYEEFEDLDVELHRFSEFFKGMTSVTNSLDLVVQWQMDIFTYLNKVNPPIMFFHLVRLKVTLCEFSLNNAMIFWFRCNASPT